MKNAFSSIGAKQRDQYSWIAKTDEGFVFTVEIDHIDQKNNVYNHKKGTFYKNVRGLSKSQGDSSITISHSNELFNAVTDAYKNKLKCRVVLLKGTKYGKSTGGIKAAIDGDCWIVTEVNGDVDTGYDFIIERTAIFNEKS